MTDLPIIAVTMGDPAGVGAEVIVKALSRAEVTAMCRPVVIGDAHRLTIAAQLCGLSLRIRVVADPSELASATELSTITVIDPQVVPAALEWGVVSPQAGEAAYRYVAIAAQLAISGKVQAICTLSLIHI